MYETFQTKQQMIILSELPMLLTPRDVSSALGIPLGAAYRLFTDRSFPSTKIGGKHIISKFKLMAWLGYDVNTEKIAKCMK